MKPPISEPVFNPEREMFEITEIMGPDTISKHLFVTEGEANDFLIDYKLMGQPAYHSDIKNKMEIAENRKTFCSLLTIKEDDKGKVSICAAFIPFDLKKEKIHDATFYGDAARKIASKLPPIYLNHP